MIEIRDPKKPTQVVVRLDESDHPSLEFYKKFLPLPLIPEDSFVGTNTDPYFLLAAESFFSSSNVKLADWKTFFATEKRVDNIAAFNRIIEEEFPSVNNPKYRMIRYRFLRTQRWDVILKKTVLGLTPEEAREGKPKLSIWDLFYAHTQDIEKTIYLCIWAFYNGEGTSTNSFIPNAFRRIPAEDIDKKGVISFLRDVRTLRISTRYANQDHYFAIALALNITPEILKVIKTYDKTLVKLKATLEMGLTEETEIIDLMKTMPVEWAKDIVSPPMVIR